MLFCENGQATLKDKNNQVLVQKSPLYFALGVLGLSWTTLIVLLSLSYDQGRHNDWGRTRQVLIYPALVLYPFFAGCLYYYRNEIFEYCRQYGVDYLED